VWAVATELRDLRRAVRLNQQAFAALIGASIETLRTWDSGRRPVPLAILQRARKAVIDLPRNSELLSLNQLAREFGVHVRTLQAAARTGLQGFEMAAEVRGAHNTAGRVSYSLHDGKFVDFVQAFGDANTQLAGKRFEMSARHLFSGGIVVAPNTGLVGDIILKYVGDRYLNKRNTALAPSFTTIDAGVGYRLSRYELRLDGHNLSDRRDAVSESELGDTQYYRMPARRIDVAFGVRF
jgi:DNA-binding transcriptional regulator YiaG